MIVAAIVVHGIPDARVGRISHYIRALVGGGCIHDLIIR